MKKLPILILLLIILIPGIAWAADITSKEQLNRNGITIGVSQGSVVENIIKRELPNASLAYFTDSGVLGYQAVAAGKIDAYIADLRQMELSLEGGLSGVHLLDETMNETMKTAVGISQVSKIPDLEKKINEFLSELREDGTLDEMFQRWVVEGNEQMPEIELDEDPKYHLVVGTAGIVPPYSYYKGTELNGHDIELAYRLADWLDADLEFKVIDFSGLIPAAATGKIDCIISDLQISEERRENFTFSDPIMEERVGIMVRGEAPKIPEQSPAPVADFVVFDGKNIGVVTGSTGGPAVEEYLPNAKISYFDSVPDMLTALRSQKVDAAAATGSILKFARMEGENINITDDHLISTEIAALFPKTEKGQKLEAQYSEFVRKLWADGTIDEIDSIWFGEDESKKTVPDYENFPKTNGTLKMAADTGIAPFVYLKDGKIVGYDVDIAARFCEAYGYRLEIQNMSFPAIIPSVVSGKSDFSACDIAITPERAESVLFSEPTYYDGLVLAVPGTGENSGISDQILAMDGKRIAVLTGSISDQAVQNTLPAANLSYYNNVTDMVTVPERPSFEDDPEGVYETLSDLSGKRIGVQTGTSFDKTVLSSIPDAKIVYLNNKADLVNSLLTFKIDGIATDEPVAQMLTASNEKLTYIPEYIEAFDFGYVFPKNDKGEDLCDEFNEFLEQIKSDGTLTEIEKRWFNKDESEKKIPDHKYFPAPNGTLRLAVEALYEPFCYIAGNQIIGYDIDIAARFCEAYGYGLTINDMSFDAVLSAVQTGKADFGGSGINITPERAESVLFSEPNYSGGTVIMVLREGESVPPEFASFSELGGHTISMLTGAPFEDLVRSKIPDVGQFSFYNNMPDAMLALKAGKTDAVLSNSAVASLSINRNPELTLLPDQLQDGVFGIAFPKGSPERDVWQKAYDSISEETILALWEKWTGADETLKVIPEQDWPGTGGTVTAAVLDTVEPMSYQGKNGELLGFDIEMILLMAKELDVHVQFTGMDLAAVLTSVQSGKAMLGAGSIIISKEREEAVDFIPVYPTAFVLVVRTAGYAEKMNTSKIDTVRSGISDQWASIKASFEKTFIREDRWKLFLEGIGNTLLITVLSIIFGTILGFLLFMLCRNGNTLANTITAVCTWLVQGMPGVVLLMILFYVVFGSVAIDGIVVAVIGFTLTFGASVFGLLKLGVGAIDNGQCEAACALGYSNTRTFFRIILPQAVPHVMGAYKGEIVGLLKATAIVGYIAVQDLTKMGDIVRSRTYEAFFPLIAVTIIYFALEIILGIIIDRINVQIDPKRRKRENILKGVKTND